MADQNDRHVVGAAGVVGRVDQPIGRLLERAAADVQNRRHLVVTDRPVKPVGAQQERVPVVQVSAPSETFSRPSVPSALVSRCLIGCALTTSGRAPDRSHRRGPRVVGRQLAQ